MAKKARRTFREKLEDYERAPEKWEVISSHAEKASRKGARRHGTSTQRIYRHWETGERIVRHTVVDDRGHVIDDHFRPEYRPRRGDVDESFREPKRDG